MRHAFPVLALFFVCLLVMAGCAGPPEDGDSGLGSDSGGDRTTNGAGPLAVPQFCTEHTGMDKDLCLADTAVEESDPSICGRISDDELADSCYQKLAMSGYGECEAIGNIDLRDGCYAEQAALKQDAAECGKISAEKNYDACMLKIAEDGLDTGICGSLKTQSSKDWCYAKVALETEDVGVCGMIADEGDVDACRELITGTGAGE